MKPLSMYVPGSLVVWEGASLYDGKPVMVVVTGMGEGSENAKTGGMVQTWIIRSDIAPNTAALGTGDDVSVCGDCPHRPLDSRSKIAGRCYVKVSNAPRSIHATYMRGRYAKVSLEVAGEMLRGRSVRLGSYGDPAAIPFEVWSALVRFARNVTGYTHGWRSGDPRLASLCMASADSPEDRAEAKAKGYRTFRVRRWTKGKVATAETLGEGEIVCPASKEGNFRVTCEACGLCGGNSRKARDIAIVDHGVTAPKGDSAWIALGWKGPQ